MAEICLKNVTKRYGDVVALDSVSFTIRDGSFTSVFGPPSAGKSVLLRVLLGLETIDSGSITINDKDVTNALPSERNLSMVFQNLALFPHLTARQNIVFPMVRRRAPQHEIDKRLDRLAGVLNIAHILEKKPAALSGGERQRVAISRALIRDAAAYMMDEPIAALDARLRETMRVELKRLQTELGQTFIYVTHDSDEAMSVADEMVILQNGRVEQVSPPEKVYDAPVSVHVAQLVGTPRINIVNGTVDKNKIKSPFGDLTLIKAPSAKGAVSLALRPEDLTRSSAAKAPLKGEVSDIENLGSFSIITITAGDAELRLIDNGHPDVSIGSTIGVDIDVSEVMAFDPPTGGRVV